MKDFYLDFDEYVHKSLRLHRVDHLHTRTLPTLHEGLYAGSEYRHSLWAAREDAHYPPIIICDRDRYVHNGREDYSLRVIDEEEQIREYVEDLPSKLKHKIVDMLNAHGHNLPTKLEEVNLPRELAQSRIFTTPIPTLKSTSAIEKIGDDWTALTHELTGWNAPQKDARLRIVQKPHLLRGLNMRINPHAVICTNGGTTKSTVYRKYGVLVDRSTRSSMTGFAKNPEEVFISTLHNNELPYAIDQIESNYWNILSQAFNVMESGSARVDVGSTKVYVNCNCPIIILANPTESTTDPTKDFSLILNHLSRNPALGRRFGSLVYGSDFATVPPGKDEDLREWDKALTFFRAVEDYARPRLLEIAAEPALWDWLSERVPAYAKGIQDATMNISDDLVRSFLNEHGNAGQHRLKAAAFYASLVDNLNLVALDAVRVDELIDDAQHRLHDYMAINLASVENIAKGFNKIRANLVRVWFESLPLYQRYLVSACELWRRAGAGFPDVDMAEIGRHWRLADPYHSTPVYLSKSIDTLKRKPSAQTRLNQACAEYLRFSVYPVDSVLRVHYTDLSFRPEIEPLGEISTVSTVSTFLRPVEAGVGEVAAQPSSGGRRNVENVENVDVEEGLLGVAGAILALLSRRGEACSVGQIAEGLGFSGEAVERGLMVLARDGRVFQPRPGFWRRV